MRNSETQTSNAVVISFVPVPPFSFLFYFFYFFIFLYFLNYLLYQLKISSRTLKTSTTAFDALNSETQTSNAVVISFAPIPPLSFPISFFFIFYFLFFYFFIFLNYLLYQPKISSRTLKTSTTAFDALNSETQTSNAVVISFVPIPPLCALMDTPNIPTSASP